MDRSLLRAPLAFALAAFTALPAFAAQRTFVASYGNDANASTNCSIAAPCRTFAASLPVTSNGGEVVALDSAGYGAITIVRSVTIIGPPGIHAGITVSGGTAVLVGAPPDSTVTLRGLEIVNLTSGGSGIYGSGANLRIENTSVDGFDSNVLQFGPGTLHIADSRLTRGALTIGGFGGTVRFSIERTYVTPGAATTWTVKVQPNSSGIIKDSTIEGFGGGGSYGVYTSTNSGPATPVELVVQNSIVQGFEWGIYSDATGGSYSSVAVTDSQLLKNVFAVSAVSGGSVALSSCKIAHNQYGVTSLSGPVYTDGRNWFGYNFADLNGISTLTGPGGVR